MRRWNFGRAHGNEQTNPRKGNNPLMTLTNRYPRTLQFALIFFILLVLPFQTTVLGKKHQSSKSKRPASRAEKGKKLSAKERRAGRRSNERVSAKQSRRGGKSNLSRRELQRERKLSAREQTAALKALERKLRRPLTKRERAAALRGNSRQRRRELLEARRRAEAARRAAIARQRAIEKAMRDEAQTFISRDDTTGEDPEVRRIAVNELGYHAGTVFVMDQITGKIYSVVNQEWALRRGFKPCSTIKLVTGIAGLEEKVISPLETTNISDKYQLDLTDALAYSNNTYFQHVGGQVGFEKMMSYARELGLGEKTGVNEPNEYSGRLPLEKSGFALNRMSYHGDDFEVTALQLGTMVSALANGGKLLVPYVPRNSADSKPRTKVRRQLDVSQDNLRRMVPGMVGSVNYGSGKKAYDPLQTVAGKTGTCIGQGSWLGLFASYAPLANPRLAVVVIGRGSDARNHFPAAVAGKIYRDLGSRFGAPINLQLATSKPNNDSKAAQLNEEDKDEAEAAAAESEANADEADTATTASAPAEAARPAGNQTPAPRDTVKRVLMPIEPRSNQVQRPETKSMPTITAGKAPSQPDDRPRKTQP
jgi:penicillin-binding protein 2